MLAMIQIHVYRLQNLASPWPVPHMCTSSVRSLDSGAAPHVHLEQRTFGKAREFGKGKAGDTPDWYLYRTKRFVLQYSTSKIDKIIRRWTSEWARHDKKTRKYLSGTERRRPLDIQFKFRRCPQRITEARGRQGTVSRFLPQNSK